MSTTQRGLFALGIIILAFVLCGLLTSWMTSQNVAVGLPVITVPGEAFGGQLPSDPGYSVFNFGGGGWTNTFLAMLLADALVIIFLLLALRSSKNWTREVPGRFQAWVELVGEFMYNQTKSFAGNKPLARNWLFPLAATIFVFLLAANWMKLLPGVETVGVLHCAHEGFSGYPSVQVGNQAYQLYVDSGLNPGLRATEEDYHNCEHYKEHPELKPSKDAIAAAAATLAEEEGHLREELAAEGLTAAEIDADARINTLRFEVIETVYEHPSFPLSAEQLSEGAIPYIQVVTPFVRGAATDLNLTIGLALVTFFAIQVFGVAAQGPAYFQKFININALGNLQKKPMGAIDFFVGVFEIVSEIGKIISLAFRLFGNMFAGGILLAVMSFLVAALLPVIFYGLEVIVTTIQAYVFAVLTIVFSAQAMEGHHSDDEHGDEHGEEAHAH